MKWTLNIFIYLISFEVHAQHQLLPGKMHHLRYGSGREWSSFPRNAEDSIMIIHFNVNDTVASAILSVRQVDVNREWKVSLNKKPLGSLVIDEKDISTIFDVPTSLLQQKNNELIIWSPRDNNLQPDDILVGEIKLIRSSKNAMLSESTVHVQVAGDDKTFLPSRITIVNANGSLQPLLTEGGDSLAVRTGVIYSGTGNFTFHMPAGKYKMYASRGFEYGVDSVQMNVKSGDTITKHLTIRHEVILPGWLSCDPHIHTLTYSGHGDASMKERVITIAGEGLDIGVITEHNRYVNIHDTVEMMGMGKWFIPITGDEVTTRVGHFNVFPVDDSGKVIDADVHNWDELAENIKKEKGVKVVILNHARDRHLGFRPFDTANVLKWKIPANAMEIMNSGSQQTNPRQLYLDWMALMNRGVFLAPVGSSDSHDVSRFIVGQSRTYVRASSPGEVAENFAKGRVGVSFGLFTEIIVDSIYVAGDLVPAKNNIVVKMKVYAPTWVKANRLTLYANGKPVFVSKVGTGIHRFIMKNPGKDVWFSAVAEGAGINVPWWPVAKPYQHDSPEVNPIVLGVSGAIRIDADGDGKFSSTKVF